ncbi:hypothetical protein BBO99_00003810 [Phytophthora kernoviae]|uniref:FYVE-type domain-containing protein n=2 Tax=Phytophthora kernoviae TaxID=325452 RepID=A0A3R7IF96_9STRA|nr:hypothetical protein G195_004260 [Phytophthora kernoviae 00238/432]KAG2527595.1 hypothetical protein JM16_003370 [Phytophthora kernoviae]KAG2528873.1 hypothetical protein JM18_003110 [Phytophthora kernoviae]RLN02869.1 hypothetical protein BBI17_003870 [Phytophthora kernoviae]RLN81307.1 hypothetical protein BBO99_00003810 [Phytophthora kernoviae]
MFRRNNSTNDSRASTGGGGNSSSRAFAEQVARQYEVPRAMTKERVTEFAQLAEQRTNQLIRLVTDDDQGVAGSVASTAVLRQQKENFEVYEMHDEKDELLIMKGVVRLQNTTCDEVMALMSGRTAMEVDAFLQDLLGAQYAAGQALHYTDVSVNEMEPAPEPNTPGTPQTPSGSKPTNSSLMVQWMALNDVHPQAPLREFFFMRYNQTFTNGNGGSSPLGGGASYGVSVFESIELPRCGPIFSQTHMQRQAFHKCGFLVEASDDKNSTTTRVTLFVTAPYRAPSLEQDRAWLLRLAGCIRLIPSAIVNRRIRRNQIRDRRNWHYRDTCSVCNGAFSMFTRRAHHCRICGAAVCSKCSAIRKDAQRSKFGGSTRVCMACLNGDQNGPNGASSTYDARSSSSGGAASSSRGSDGESFGTSSHVTLEEALAAFTIEPTLAANHVPVSPSSTSGSGRSEDDGNIYANTPFDYELTFNLGNPWPDAPRTSTEKERTERIKRLNLSEDFAKTVLRDLLDLARTTMNCPVAALSVVTKSTSLFVATIGLVGDQVPRDVGLDGHVLMSHDPLVSLDCRKDIRYTKNPLALAMGVQFFVGIPLIMKDTGVVVGAICLGDTKARKKVKGSDIRALQVIAARIVDKTDAHNNDMTENRPEGVRLLGFADQVARQYEVPRIMTKSRIQELAQVGEKRANQLIRWVSDDDQGVAGSAASGAVLRQQKENFEVYEMHDDKDDLLVMKGVVRLQNTSCDEVLALLSGRTAVEEDAFLQDLLGAQYAAGQALHYTDVNVEEAEPTPEPGTPGTPQSPRGSRPTKSSLMVEWMALNDVHPQAPLREFFYMRFNQSFSNGNGGNNPLGGGASYGVSVLESLDLPRCGPIFSQAHMQRQPLHKSGFVVEASEEKNSRTTRVSLFVTAPYRAPSLEQDRAWLLRLAGCVRLIPSAIVNRRIRRNQLRDRRTWHFRDSCSVCNGNFSMFTRRAHHCRICGAAVCSKCSAIRKEAQRFKFGGSTRVCMACLNGDQNGAKGTSSTYDNRSGVSRSSASESSRSDSECFGTSAHVTLEEALAGFTIEPTLAANRSPDSPSSASTSSVSMSGEDDGDVYANTPFSYELTFNKGNPWPDAPHTHTEKERVQRIQSLNLSEKFAKTILQDLLQLAATTVNCQVAALSVVTASTSLFVATLGLVGDQVPRDVGVDAHALMSEEPLVILDCRKDIRFAKNPLALSMGVQFFLGVPLVMTGTDVVVGAICIADTKARKKVKGSDLRALKLIATRIVEKMDAHNNEISKKAPEGVRLL